MHEHFFAMKIIPPFLYNARLLLSDSRKSEQIRDIAPGRSLW